VNLTTIFSPREPGDPHAQKKDGYNAAFGATRVSHHLGAIRKSRGFAEENPPGAEVFHKVFHRNC